MRAIAIVLAALCAGQLPAQEQQTRTRLQLELELAKAKSKAAVVAAKPAPLGAHTDYGAAHREALVTGKPLFASVVADCTDLCPTLRPEFVTAHLADLAGDRRPRYVLSVPRDGALWQAAEWPADKKPTDNQVRAAHRAWLATHPIAQPVAAPIVPVIDWAKAT